MHGKINTKLYGETRQPWRPQEQAVYNPEAAAKDAGSEEEWRPIPDFEGYEASSVGRIRSLERVIQTNQGPKRFPGKMMGQWLLNGYWTCALTLQGRSYFKGVHLWMAKAFLDRPDVKQAEVDHIDRNTTHNHLSNLRWISGSLNKLNGGISKANKSGVRGVSWCKQTSKWRVTFKRDRVTINLGRFSSLEAARVNIEQYNRTKAP